MPCDASRLIRQRFRAHHEEALRQAVAVWSAGTALVQGMPKAVDARAFAGAWPMKSLCADWLASRYPEPTPPGTRLPAPEAEIYRTLLQLLQIDPIGFALVIDGVRYGVDSAEWRQGLGVSEDGLIEQAALALLRALTIHLGLLDAVCAEPSGVCLRERWFSTSDRSEVMAMSRAKKALGDKSMTMPDFRDQLTLGGEQLLELLRGHPTLRVLLSPTAMLAFRRALQLSSQHLQDVSYEAPLFAYLAREVAEAAPRTPKAHRGAGALLSLIHDRLSPGGAPSTSDLLSTIEHLVACEDDRCPDLARAEAVGHDAARRSLWAPIATPASWPAPSPMLGPSHPDMARCRDVLWEAFAGLPDAPVGPGEVAGQVARGMARYAELRASFKKPVADEQTPPAPASVPAASRRSAGLRLGRASTPPPPSDDEATEPRR